MSGEKMSSSRNRPGNKQAYVFHDPSGRRARNVRLLGGLAIALCLAMFAAFAATLAFAPHVPEVRFRDPRTLTALNVKVPRRATPWTTTPKRPRVQGTAIRPLTIADFDKVVGINLNAVMYGVLAVLPHMRSSGSGTLILNSSWAGRYPSGSTGAAYNAAKHAVVALGQSINAENGMRNIRCTVLMTGGVATPIWQANPTPPTPERLANMLQSEDIGDLVRYIAEAPPNVCFNEIVVAPTRNRVIAV